MNYRQLGNSGLNVSVVCLGTMMFGDRTDAAQASEIVAHAFDAGVNFIDTADVYANGASETITGAAIQAQRARWILATKVGNSMTGEGNGRPHTGGLSRRWILQACDASLARLGTDWIDIYYLHDDDAQTPLAETVGGDRRADRRRQDPLLRRVELSRLAHRRGDALVRAARRAAAGRLPAVLQPAEPDARGRSPARLRPLRHRRRIVLADRARRADRQVRAGTTCPTIRARRATTGG